MTICSNFSGLAISQQNNDLLVAQLGCGMWSCAHCADKLRKKWRAKIINGINVLGGVWSWFTLTAHSQKRGAVASIANLRAAWQKLIKRMRRKYGAFAYVRVYEQHKDNSFHIHAIANVHFGDIKTRVSKSDNSETKYSAWLAATAKKLKIGYYTHAEDIAVEKSNAGYVASYVTKYMTKMSGKFKGELGRTRRIQTTQNWPKLPQNTGLWTFAHFITQAEAIALNRDDMRVLDVSTGEVITAQYWTEDKIFYPERVNEQYKKWSKDS